jgi:hypothetical protein
MRTDEHNNPTAFTTEIARLAGLRNGVDYVEGKQFSNDPKFKTAKLLGDPVALTIEVIDKLGFYTQRGTQRWIYIAMPTFVWNSLTPALKKKVIGFMYSREGGTALTDLFRDT